MRNICIAPIVEGHGEFEAIRILLTRIWIEVCDGDHAEIVRPIRHPKSRLVRKEQLTRAIELAAAKLARLSGSIDQHLILVLVDADEACPADLGKVLQGIADEARPDICTLCTVANVEYETWFVACSSSLGEFFNPEQSHLPHEAESSGRGKNWVAQHMRRGVYSETVDQPALTSKMSLTECQANSPSFSRLCRKMQEQARGSS